MIMVFESDIDNEEVAHDVEDVMERLGYGWTHYYVALVCFLASSSDAIEIVCISFVLPSLACELNVDSLWQGALNSVIFVGLMLGGFFWSSMADTLGRRSILIASLLVNGLAAAFSSLAQSFWLFFFLRLISGIGVGGSYPVVFSYYSEWQTRSRRGAAVALLSCMWMFGGIATAGAAWLLIPNLELGISSTHFVFNSWRIFVLVCSFPSIISAFLFFCAVQESPKYLIQNGRGVEAVHLINKVAVKYGRATPNGALFVEKLKLGRWHSLSEKKFDPEDAIDEEQTLLNDTPTRSLANAVRASLFKWKQLFSKRYRSVVLTLIGVQATLAFGFYGLTLWFPSLFARMERYGGSPCSVISLNGTLNVSADACDTALLSSTRIYYESFLVNLSNLPGNVLAIILIDKTGRNSMMVISMLLTALSVFFITLVRTQTQAVIMSCCFSALSAIGWNALAVISTEILPTNLRSTAIGMAQALSRIASILGNLLFGGLVDVNCVVPMLLSAGALTFGGLLALRFPNLTKCNSQ